MSTLMLRKGAKARYLGINGHVVKIKVTSVRLTPTNVVMVDSIVTSKNNRIYPPGYPLFDSPAVFILPRKGDEFLGAQYDDEIGA